MSLHIHCCLYCFFAINSEYRLSFLEGNAITCQQSSSAVTILPSKVPLKLEFIPGIKSVAHISTELKTLANYTLCYRAATTNKVNKILIRFLLLYVS